MLPISPCFWSPWSCSLKQTPSVPVSGFLPLLCYTEFLYLPSAWLNFTPAFLPGPRIIQVFSWDVSCSLRCWWLPSLPALGPALASSRRILGSCFASHCPVQRLHAALGALLRFSLFISRTDLAPQAPLCKTPVVAPPLSCGLAGQTFPSCRYELCIVFPYVYYLALGCIKARLAGPWPCSHTNQIAGWTRSVLFVIY